MATRRGLLARSARLAGLLATLGLLPAAAVRAQPRAYADAAFDAHTLGEVVKALGAAAPTASAAVTITGPDVAENGAAVPLGVAASVPGVERLLLLVEKNPNMLSAIFEVSDAVVPDFALRVKMNESSDVHAVALMADGRVLYATRHITVTLGGCSE